MSRPKHPKKEIEEAVKYAESQGWTFKAPGKSAHVWGTMLCPEKSREGHRFGVYSTPKVPAHHAKRLKGAVDECAHGAAPGG